MRAPPRPQAPELVLKHPLEGLSKSRSRLKYADGGLGQAQVTESYGRIQPI